MQNRQKSNAKKQYLQKRIYRYTHWNVGQMKQKLTTEML